MPQNFVSRYNNLLAIKGRGGIEYTAGPNIDISDYIISGRDWTSDINAAIEGVKGSSFDATTAWVDSQGYLTEHQDVSNLPYVQNSALEFYGVHISGISGSGLYAQSSEGAFLAETANFAYHSESADTAGYAESAGITDSANYALTALFANSATSSLMADTAVYAYTADKADDLTNWTYTDSAMTGIKGYNGTAFISQDLQYWDYTDSAHTAIKGYNGTAFAGGDGSCPWISGSKVIGNVTADFGNTYQLISSFDFSGDKNHHISLKGSWITFPTTGHIASALDDKFDTSSFNNFITNGFNPNMTELHGATAYLSAFVNTGCVHNSALDPTIYNMFSGISGSGLYATSAQNAFTAETANWAENAGYIADGWEYNGNNEITGYSGSAFASEGGDTTPWISGNKYIDPEVLLDFGDAVQVVSSFTVSGYKNHAIALKGRQLKLPSTAHIGSALDDKLDTTVFNNYTANADNAAYTAGANIDITNHVVSGKDWLPIIESGDSGKLDISAFENYTATAIAGDYELSAGAGISIVDYPEESKTVISVTGGGTGGGSYVAGQYIDIDQSNIISVTGLAPYSAGSNININNNVVSGKDWTNTITAASAYAAAQATGKVYQGVDPIVVNNSLNKISADTAELIAGDYISFATASTSTTINGYDWGPTISAASANAAAEATGKEYTGIAPIVVNNSTDQISADCTELIAGNGIEFVTAANSTTINCTATAAGGSTYEISYNSPATGYTGSAGLVISEYIGQTGSRRSIMSGTRTIGELIPSGYGASQYLTTNSIGNLQWSNIPDTGIKVEAVATSGDATGSNILYIVTGS